MKDPDGRTKDDAAASRNADAAGNDESTAATELVGNNSTTDGAEHGTNDQQRSKHGEQIFVVQELRGKAEVFRGCEGGKGGCKTDGEAEGECATGDKHGEQRSACAGSGRHG